MFFTPFRNLSVCFKGLINRTFYHLLQTGLIGEDEAINEFEGMDEVEVEEIMRKREARGRAQVLEMVVE